MTKHIMLDLETWSTKGFIVSIGVAEFDPWSHGVGELFHQAIDPADVARYGFRPDPDTLLWWMHEDQREALDAWLDLPKVQLDEALIGFQNWVQYTLVAEPNDLIVWGNGATFDNVLLRSTFEALKFDVPWSYKNDRCFRTLKNMGRGAELPSTEGILHDALADALWQAHAAQAIVKHLKLEAL